MGKVRWAPAGRRAAANALRSQAPAALLTSSRSLSPPRPCFSGAGAFLVVVVTNWAEGAFW